MYNPKAILLISFLIVIAFFYIIKRILAKDRSFTDFIVGESGKYSLSRLQALIWAVVIITYQVSVMVAMYQVGQFTEFQLVFAENTIWLLGLSLGSYITVKGISVNQMANQGPQNFTLPTQRKWSDLIVSDEGLDLSRFQMLIWTILAVLVFLNSVDSYLTNILSTNTTEAMQKLFPRFDIQDADNKILPDIDMSFLVLMGLSQGAYIGRKLVPSQKVADFKKENLEELKLQLNTMDTGLRFKETEYELMKASSTIPPEEKMKAAKELENIQAQRNKLQQQLDEIQKEQNTNP